MCEMKTKKTPFWKYITEIVMKAQKTTNTEYN